MQKTEQDADKERQANKTVNHHDNIDEAAKDEIVSQNNAKSQVAIT